MFDAAFSNNMAQAPLKPGDIVCYYTDGLYQWDQAAIDHYAGLGYRMLGISSIGTDSGDMLDIEPRNLNALESVDWTLKRRAAGVDPKALYTAEWAPGYRKQDVDAAFADRGVRRPPIWIAPWPNDQVPPDCVAAQFGYVGPYDISAVVDGWPDGTFSPPIIALEEQEMFIVNGPDGIGFLVCALGMVPLTSLQNANQFTGDGVKWYHVDQEQMDQFHAAASALPGQLAALIEAIKSVAAVGPGGKLTFTPSGQIVLSAS
jgi:hypothetical protein